MSKLHLDYDGEFSHPHFYLEQWTELTAKMTNKAMLQKFPALEALHLDTTNYFDPGFFPHDDGLWALDAVFSELSEIQLLPLKTATVICMGTLNSNLERLSRTENLKLAEDIRLRLLD